MSSDKERIQHLEQENAQLKEKALLFQNLLDSITDNIYFKDEESRFVLVNEGQAKFMNLLGLQDKATVNSLLGKSDKDFFPGVHSIETYLEEKRIMETGVPLKREEKHILKDGRECWMYSVKAPNKDANGNVTGTLGISRDITKLKQAQEKLQEMNQRLLYFFRIITENLSNPFDTLIGFSKLLIDSFDTIEIKRVKSFHQFIHQSAQDAHILLENVLAWAKLQTNELSYTPGILDINTIIKQNIHILSTVAHQKEIKIENLIKHPLDVYVDGAMISIVVRNLLVSAIKFTQQGGHIKILGSNKSPDMVRIEVSDTKDKISQKKYQKLFDTLDNVYFKSDDPDERSASLGLIVSKSLIQKNHGEIRTESSRSKETSSFVFTLPRHENAINIAKKKQ